LLILGCTTVELDLVTSITSMAGEEDDDATYYDSDIGGSDESWDESRPPSQCQLSLALTGKILAVRYVVPLLSAHAKFDVITSLH
jgi:hypothetical protein